MIISGSLQKVTIDRILKLDDAKLRWIERKSIDELVKHFKVGRTFPVAEIARIKARPNLVEDGPARRLVKLKEKRFLGDS